MATPPDNDEWYSTHPHTSELLLVGWIVGTDGNDNGARAEGNRHDNGDHGEMATRWPAATPLVHCATEIWPQHLPFHSHFHKWVDSMNYIFILVSYIV